MPSPTLQALHQIARLEEMSHRRVILSGILSGTRALIRHATRRSAWRLECPPKAFKTSPPKNIADSHEQDPPTWLASRISASPGVRSRAWLELMQTVIKPASFCMPMTSERRICKLRGGGCRRNVSDRHCTRHAAVKCVGHDRAQAADIAHVPSRHQAQGYHAQVSVRCNGGIRRRSRL